MIMSLMLRTCCIQFVEVRRIEIDYEPQQHLSVFMEYLWDLLKNIA
jgi:hypothetical protein